MPLQATSGAASYDAFGGGVAVVTQYIEDVFSTYLYTGTGAALTITNNIDLSTKGGLTWIKGRSGATGHRLTDTARGVTKSLESNSTAAEATESTGLTAFGTTGFTIGADADYNTSAATYASWTFRKQPKFFDVVTYTGTGSARTVSHTLGSTPGCIIVKCTSTTSNWVVYHQKLNNGTTPQNYFIELDGTGVEDTNSSVWNNTAPTSTVFTVGSSSGVNDSGQTYVAYLFASNAAGFGLLGTDNVITCGNYDGNGSANGPEVTLGFEPQWLLIRRVSGGAAAAVIVDTMRGSSLTGGNGLYPSYNSAENGEGATQSYVYPTATGFKIGSSGAYINSSSSKYIYIAIRRPMKVPTTGTSVFSPIARTGTGSAANITTAGFTPDLLIGRSRLATTSTPVFVDRLRGNTKFLQSAVTDAEGTSSAGADVTGFLMNGFSLGVSGGTDLNTSSASEIYYPLKRAPSFMDVVCYTGTLATLNVSHNLGVVPQLIITKSRSATGNWTVQPLSDGTKRLRLQTTAAETSDAGPWNNTNPTSSVFTLGADTGTNASGVTYVAYLFSTCAGVSKVGSYTGNGSSQTINCGFTGGARFVLIKATSTTGDWMVSDSARGIIAGSDPYLELNNTNAEVTGEDWLDTDSTGFVVNEVSASNANTNGVSYIFLAIA